MSGENTNSFMLGEFIKELRKEKGYTLREVAEKTGISNTYISNLENGVKDSPSMETLFKLSKALDVNYTQLLEKSGYISEKDNILTKDEENAFEAAAFLKSSEELYLVNQQLEKSKSVEERTELLNRKERLEKRISKKWNHYDEVYKNVIEHIKDEVSLLEANNKAFENDLSIPVFVDEQNNINIKVYKKDYVLNPEDTKTLNSMIKGFLFDKKFFNYNDEN
ncbi:helix-turn-helix domain-containing protein [Lysinibacillus sp. OTC-L20]|uniref:helix-turn-helix domain-containing protein n=1 Tax=Lysinibacillus sp. OTC-L20 TaxID=3342791 RepID=UPI0035B91DFF